MPMMMNLETVSFSKTAAQAIKTAAIMVTTKKKIIIENLTSSKLLQQFQTENYTH